MYERWLHTAIWNAEESEQTVFQNRGEKKEQSGRFQFGEIWFELNPTFITDKWQLGEIISSLRV